MAKTITSGVGRGGRNFPAVDVMTVQYLLNCVPAAQGGPSPELAVDGAAGPKTIAAIEKFQRALGAFCDGRVDPGGNTLRALQGRDPYPHQPIAQGGAKGGPGGGQPAGKGGGYPSGKTGGGNQGGYPSGKTGDTNQAGYPPGGKGGGSMPGSKTGGPCGGGGGGSGMLFPGGKSGGGKGF
jgi:hypothetical protein